MERIVLTMPIAPYQKFSIGKMSTPILGEALAKKIDGEFHLAVNLLDSYKKREVEEYQKLLEMYQIIPYNYWIDNNHIDELVEKCGTEQYFNNLLNLINSLSTTTQGIDYLFGQNGMVNLFGKIQKYDRNYDNLLKLINLLVKTKKGKKTYLKKNGIANLFGKLGESDRDYGNLLKLINLLVETEQGRDYLFKENGIVNLFGKLEEYERNYGNLLELIKILIKAGEGIDYLF